MFRNRRNSQKPPEEFYAAFKDSHPDVGPGTLATSSAATSQTIAVHSGPLSNPVMDHRNFGSVDDHRANESTFRATNEEWRLTPSLVDVNSFSFASFANQAPGYCTPATGGTGAYYHSKAGDLHTPNLGFHLGTPLSLPHSEGPSNATAAFDMHAFQPNFLGSTEFHVPSHFGSEQTFAPSSFLHQDPGFQTIHGSSGNTPGQQTIAGSAIKQQPTSATPTPKTFNPTMPEPHVLPANK
ncbi:MAG: hypothetical protein LQ346_000310 [Caloplaca aetnensis]|nr:MAG: hypothetical protein LQ346_000310 [Caloplaca aetnensis]